MDACLDKIRSFYARPMRKGAMLTWREAKTYYYQIVGALLFGCLFSYSAILERGDQNPSDFLVYACWSIVACSLFAATIFIAIVYGYHHRRDIDPGDEMRIDLSRAYLGGALAAILAPIVHLVIDYFAG